MRKSYFSGNGKSNSFFKILIAMFISTIMAALVMLGISYLICSTSLSEKLIGFAAIITNAILAISYSGTLVLNSKIKPIICSIVAFAIIVLIKLMLNITLSTEIIISIKGILMLGALLLFCILGGGIFANIKK